ncbi:MAG: hypothetical protein JWP12_2512 [Bacteroidetes bacterium]|nr:hypothetical protein [Bacteroidota bacterium]
MAKGKIITSTDNEHGFVQNDGSDKKIPYIQPLSKELGLKVGMFVRYDVLKDPVTGDKTAVNVELYKKGIITGKDNDHGMIEDPNFGQIHAMVPMMSQQGIKDNTLVKYELLNTSDGMIAVYVKTAPDPDPDQASSTK